MPPRARTPKPRPEPEQPAPRHAKVDGPICGDCWPEGWPVDSTAAVCDHGRYQR